MKKNFTLHETKIAQVRYFETLYVIKDQNGATLFTGEKALATKILGMLKKDKVKKASRK